MTRLKRSEWSLPADAWRAFRAHKDSATRRGIPFRFDPASWWSWWQEDDRWSRRQPEFLEMARYRDEGSFSPGNVYCAGSHETLADAKFAKRSAAAKRGAEGRVQLHLTAGSGHPKSRGVTTLLGRHPNASQAAKRHGITRQAAARKARLGTDGWFYTDG